MTAPSPAGLLSFEGRLRSARTAHEADFLAANEPHTLFGHEQTLLWKPGPSGKPLLAAASGLAEIEPKSPFGLWFSRAVSLLAGDGAVRRVATTDFPAELDDGAEWMPAALMLVPLSGPDGKAVGGLWMTADRPWTDEDVELARWAGQVVGHALWAWERKRLAAILPNAWRRLPKRRRRLALLALPLLAVVPIRLSVLAPAEVVPAHPVSVTAPADGVVAQVLVAPNQRVAAGTLLLEMDDTATRNRLLVATKALDTARADLARASSKSFSDDASKAELQLLDARVRERAADVAYLNELLGRLKPVAPAAATALFADADEWRGRPVQTGERIMTLADPSQAALAVYVAPDDAIALDIGADVRAYLNVSPLDSYAASITQASYEAGTSPEGTPAYVVKAAFADGEDTPRLGLKGTAKVYGGWTVLGYYVMRKPLRALRRALGV
ncbi:MAG TPA: HlyD family efflux transporter periplasmic adaptor subunit [Noviherbaspirillum sp.]|jgi:hypothetical protein|uniref:HlyD family efflux transporter periplasmic adaptor subunit n=1 Tax=Noviherbaspirillum sp. TaxID=1926288 RepID=UPI002F91DB85